MSETLHFLFTNVNLGEIQAFGVCESALSKKFRHAVQLEA